eukprot:TRINITY_DN5360_c0_g1_i1.p1 TRINITY_DN5360_c0_g1~~TRINITY_DN5360_c0_g1_i1.p1  ORF type:complete len:473 (-),score=152.35 TRINITY_DN5360_c0_g1_i1:32-1450(-)
MENKEDILKQVWRLPMLMKQVDVGLIQLNELVTMIQVASQAKVMYAANIVAPGLINAKDNKKAKTIKSRSTSSTERPGSASSSGGANTIANAIFELKGYMESEAENAEREAKALDEFARSVTEVVVQIQKERKQLEESVEKERANVLSEREKLVNDKRKKECQKMWESLQENVRKLMANRQVAAACADNKKQQKMNKELTKMEDAIHKQRQKTYDLFKDVETTFQTTNNRVSDYYYRFCGKYVIDKLKKLEELRAQQVGEVLTQFIGTSKTTSENIISACSKLDAKIKALNGSVDAGLFMNGTPPQGDIDYFTPPPDVPSELPCSADALEKMIGAMVSKKAPAAPTIPSSPTGAAAAAEAEYYEEFEQLEYYDDQGYAYEPAAAPAPVEEVKAASPRASSPRPPVPPSKKKLPTAVAQYKFVGEDETQMTFESGDVIVVTDKSGDYWWGGYLETDADKVEKWFPFDYVVLHE